MLVNSQQKLKKILKKLESKPDPSTFSNFCELSKSRFLTFTAINSSTITELDRAALSPKKAKKEFIARTTKKELSIVMNLSPTLRRNSKKNEISYDYYNMITQLHKNVKKKKNTIVKSPPKIKENSNEKISEDDELSSDDKETKEIKENIIKPQNDIKESKIMNELKESKIIKKPENNVSPPNQSDSPNQKDSKVSESVSEENFSLKQSIPLRKSLINQKKSVQMNSSGEKSPNKQQTKFFQLNSYDEKDTLSQSRPLMSDKSPHFRFDNGYL